MNNGNFLSNQMKEKKSQSYSDHSWHIDTQGNAWIQMEKQKEMEDEDLESNELRVIGREAKAVNIETRTKQQEI